MSETTQQPAAPVDYSRFKWTALAVGFFAGLASALLGIGGGLIMVPAMVFFLRATQHQAVGTSLAVILPTALVAAIEYHQQAEARHLPGLDLRVILWLGIGGVVGATLGATLANALNAKQLRRTFGGFVVATGVWMILRTVLQLSQAAPVHAGEHVLELILVGVGVGVVSGLMGVGGGLVMVPALVLLLGYSQHLAQGTSLAVIIPVSISGALVHARRGNVIWLLAFWLSLGAMLGAWVMAGNVFAIPQDTLRIVFSLFLIGVGISMIRTRPPRPAPSEGREGDGS